MENYPLNSSDELTKIAKEKGIKSWNELIAFVKELPYGRNRNRTDFSLVLTEGKGSCSSKHAFLKKIADLNNIPDVSLILGIYKMNQENTPKIGNELIDNGLDFIPEAHCYLKINQKRVDFTSLNAAFEKIEKAILLEKEIEPEQVATFKVLFHQDYLKKWIVKEEINFSFDEIWKIREKCIANLSETQV